MPVLELPRGNAAKPVVPRPASAYRNPPVRAVVPNALPHGTGVLPTAVVAPPRPRSAYVNPPSAPTVVPDARPHGPGILTKAVQSPLPESVQTAYKQTPQYRQAVINVFLHQNSYQQQAVVSGALKNPSSPESGMILDYLQNYFTPPDARPHGPGILPTRVPGLPRPASAYANPKGATGGSLTAPSWTTGAIHGGTILAAARPLSGLEKELSRGLMDVVNLGAEALPTTATLLGEEGNAIRSATEGNWPAAAKSAKQFASQQFGPYVQSAEHPLSSFLEHPVQMPLMWWGALSGAGHLAAAPIRAFAPESAVGKALSTAREPVALTGNLTKERPLYSTAPNVKGLQVALEKMQYTRNPHTGELVPRKPRLLAAHIKEGVAQTIGTLERIRRVNRGLIADAHQEAVRPSRTTRAAGAARNTFRYGPDPTLIPGAGVLGRIADNTIRRPDTVQEDLQLHRSQVAATRPKLLADLKTGGEDAKRALAAHDDYIAQIDAALANNAFVRDPQAAFDAAKAYHEGYTPVEAKAAAMGHMGDMSKDALLKRAFYHYAKTHMGARVEVDPVKLAAYERALEEIPQQHPDWSFGQIQAALRKVRPEPQLLWDQPYGTGAKQAGGATRPVPLSLEEIIGHNNDPVLGTGGRMPTFTSDRVRFDREQAMRQAKYVKQTERPLPQTKANLLYAYSHGLTDPSHTALLENHTLLQGVVDAHHAQNTIAETLAHRKEDGTWWNSWHSAAKAAQSGYRPIRLSGPFHSQPLLDMALEHMQESPASIEEEAARHSYDFSQRLEPGGAGRYGLIRNDAAAAVMEHQNQISQNVLNRTIRALNNQFRTVALATSPKHVPGVAFENLVRDIANGVSVRSWLTGRRILSKAEQIDAEKGARARTQLAGGQNVGAAEQARTYTVSDHWQGTRIHTALKAMEAFFKAPGARQARTAWKTWTNFALGTTKHILEEQHQVAGLGKAALREHGYADAAKTEGFLGVWKRTMGLHGQMVEDAARGVLDPAKARQLRASIEQMYGKWTDLSPSYQTALMYSPFGLWWLNSARFLARMPVDMPVKTGLLAAGTIGTEKQRQAEGLDMFAPGHLPLYMQGGIPWGGKILAQNYYSPFGVMNDPLETGQSLIQPWLTPFVLGAGGKDWLMRDLSAPGQSSAHAASVLQRLQYMLDSGLSSFMPLYQKAKQIAEGGASAYDVTGPGLLPLPPKTKTPGRGVLAGLETALRPLRLYNRSAPGGAPNVGGGGGVSGKVRWGATGGGGSAGGWGGTGGSGSSGGWGR